MVGYVRAYRVPGNVHIASHPYMDIVNGLKAKGKQFDFSHRIDHVSFGNKQDFDYISQNFADLQMEHPCDGISYKQEYEEDGKTIKPSKTNFYMVAVPSYFEKGFILVFDILVCSISFNLHSSGLLSTGEIPLSGYIITNFSSSYFFTLVDFYLFI